MFKVIEYLDARGIPYSTSGRNVSQGWVGIQCVYPGCDDHSNHLGINLGSGVHTCWKCGQKGGPAQLVKLLEHCSWGAAKRIVGQYSTEDGYIPPDAYQGNARRATGAFMLPKTATAKLPGPHQRYLEGRGFNVEYLQRNYDVMACYTTGRYRHRVIIPMYLNGVLVNFQARDITGRAARKYLMAPNEDALVPGDKLLYGLDRAGESVALVEGVMDVWRIGAGGVAVLGTKLTEEKLSLLPQHGVQRVFVVYDQDAGERGEEIANKVSKLIRYVETIWLPKDDPDVYFANNPNDLAELRQLLK